MISSHEANLHRFDINEVLNADSNRAKSMAPIPSWMQIAGRDPHRLVSTEPQFSSFNQLNSVAYAALLPLGAIDKRRAGLMMSMAALLTSCGAPTISAVTETVQAVSPTIVETPTTAPTPTEAAPQEGDTYKDPVTGYEYTITVVRDAEGKEVYKGDFRPMTPVKIPFWDWTIRWYGENGEIKTGQDIGNVMMVVDKNVPSAEAIKAVTHEQFASGTHLNTGDDPYLEIVQGKFTLNFGIGKDPIDIFEGLQSGTIAYPFKVGSQEYTWYPSPNHGAIEYVLPYDAATMTEANGFNTWTDVPNTNEFVSKFVGIDPKGNMVWILVSKTPWNELNNEQITMLLNYPAATVIDSVNADISNKGYGPFLQTLVDESDDSTPPYIEVER